MYEEFLRAIHEIGTFSKEEERMLLDKTELLSICKGDFYLQKGQVCNGVSFINSGSFRQYFISEELEEKNVNLFVKSDWLLDHTSFTLRKESEFYTIAASDSQLLFLEIEAVHELIRISPAFFTLGKILELAIPDPELQLAQLSPEERYKKLLKDRPEFLQIFSLKDIASFLKMTPETLSRVRKRISQ